MSRDPRPFDPETVDVQAAAQRLAWHLREVHGLREGDVVAVFLPEGVERAVVVAACSSVGADATLLPLDLDHAALPARLAECAPGLAFADAARDGALRAGLGAAGLDVPVRLVDGSGVRALLRKGPSLARDDGAPAGGADGR